MVQEHASTRWSFSFVAIKARTITCLVATLIVTLFAPLAPAAAINPGDIDTSFGNGGSIELRTHHEIDGQLIDINGNTLVWGFASNNFETIHFLARYDSQGRLDEDFGKDGYFYIERKVGFYLFECIVTGITQVTSTAHFDPDVLDGTYLIALKSSCSAVDDNGVTEFKELHFLQKLEVNESASIFEVDRDFGDYGYLEFYSEDLLTASTLSDFEITGLNVGEFVSPADGLTAQQIVITGNLDNSYVAYFRDYESGDSLSSLTQNSTVNQIARSFSREPLLDSSGNVFSSGLYTSQGLTKSRIERISPGGGFKTVDPCVSKDEAPDLATESIILDTEINTNDEIYVLVHCTFGSTGSANYLRKYDQDLELDLDYKGNIEPILSPPDGINAKARAIALNTEDQVVVLFDQVIDSSSYKTWLSRYDYLGELNIDYYGINGFTDADDFPESVIALGLDAGPQDVIHLLVGTLTSGTPEYARAKFSNNGVLNEDYGLTMSASDEIADGFPIISPPNVNVNVERIATDDQDRIVVLASFSDGYDDNHILFRLTKNGSHDEGFGFPTLNGDSYVLVEKTSLLYVFERVDLEIDSDNRILVMLSGSSIFDPEGPSQNFVKRYVGNGLIDDDFGMGGRIDVLTSQEFSEDPFFMTDLTLDHPTLDDPTAEGGFLVAGFSEFIIPGPCAPEPESCPPSLLDLQIKKFDKDGLAVREFGDEDGEFGNEDDGRIVIDTEMPFGLPPIGCPSEEICDPLITNDVRIVADHAGGYTIAYSGFILGIPPIPITALLRVTSDGQIDDGFASEADDFLDFIFDSADSAPDNHLLLEGFIFTDIIPSGFESEAGILISGTLAPNIGSINVASLLLRINMDGTFDRSFSYSARLTDLNDSLLNPELEDFGYPFCYNQALFRNVDPSDSSTALIVGDGCFSEINFGSTALLAFLKSGGVDEKFGVGGVAGSTSQEIEDFNFSDIITQLEQTKNGKLLVLRGAEPSSGYLGLLLKFPDVVPEITDSVVTISGYHLRQPVTFGLMRGSETSTSTVSLTESATVGVAINGYNVKVSNKTGIFNGDGDTSFSISPLLPIGLNFDTTTARISGVPTAPLATQTFTITGELVTRSEFDYLYRDIAIATYTLTINPAVGAPAPLAPAFTLSTAAVSATTGSAINGYTISSTGGAIASFSISPALSNGTLTFNTSTGLLSGTPNTAASAATYTITATNATGAATQTFSLTVSAPTPPVVVYVAPTPVPYLKTLTTPKLNLKDGKLMCTPGTYNAGYTLDGVVQGSATTLFTPPSFRYNLLINGITQTSLAVTSSSTSQSWDIPTGSTGALVTCSVTVTANGLTNTDKSGDNTSGASSALTTQSAAIATANATYSAALSANTKAYQKALVDNRTQWRSTTEKIRTDYYTERNRINSLPSTKATRALSSAALKAYTAALKKSAADYKASGPAALTAKDVADKAALDAKTTAIAKANAAYGTAIESSGYGVLIP